jgi:hypothetical protein
MSYETAGCEGHVAVSDQGWVLIYDFGGRVLRRYEIVGWNLLSGSEREAQHRAVCERVVALLGPTTTEVVDTADYLRCVAAGPDSWKSYETDFSAPGCVRCADCDYVLRTSD